MACNSCTTDCEEKEPCGLLQKVDPTSSSTQCNHKLTPGVYPNAQIIIDGAGCIVSVQSGTPFLYTPDPCCQNVGTGSGGNEVISGLPGEPGRAATLQFVDPISLPPGSKPTVNNLGNENAALLQLGIPEGKPGEAANTGSFTSSTTTLQVDKGLVTGMSPNLPAFTSANVIINADSNNAGISIIAKKEGEALLLQVDFSQYTNLMKSYVDTTVSNALASNTSKGEG